MTFKHINFLDSPVMRELERISKAKGEFNSSSVESVVKKVAASKPKKKVSYKPGKDLMQDILKLADGLRAKGFEKQADSLETKFFDYKKAETHLYRAIDEDGEDVIDFAHPHAAKPISDSEHAKVPNILERHKKIVDVVNKQPTGKYGADVADIIKDAEDILGLKKKAQTPIPDLVVPAVGRAAAAPFFAATPGALLGGAATGAGIGLAIGALVAGGYLTYEYFVYNITDLLDAGKKLANEFDQVDVEGEIPKLTSDAKATLIPQNFKDLIAEIEKIYKDRDPQNLFNLLKKTEEARNLAARISSLFAETGPSMPFTRAPGISVHKLSQNFVEVADKAMGAWQKMLQAKVAELKETNPEEYNKITQIMAKPQAKKTLSDFSKKVPGVSQVAMNQTLATDIAKRLNNLASRSLQIGDNNNAILTAMANIFGDPRATTVPFAQVLYNLEKAGLEDIQQYKTPEDFKQNFINYWENEYKAKNSSSFKKIFEKIGMKGRPAETPGSAATAREWKPGDLSRGPGYIMPATQQARSSPAAQSPEKEAVQRLQMILNRLGMELASDPKNKNLANILIATGPKGAETIDQFDGKWGPNTDAAVQAAAKLGIEGMTPGATYSHKPKSQEEVDAAAKKAEQNTSVIVRYMNSKGMGEKIPAVLKKKRTYKTLDSVKQGSTLDDTWVSEDDYEGAGAISVTTADFISFTDLDKLIKRAVLTGAGFQEAQVQQAPKPAQQQAQGPQQTGNKQTSEQAALQRGVPSAKVNLGSFIESVRLLKSAQAATTGRTKQGWKEILQRFGARAYGQYQRASSAEDADNNVVQAKDLYIRAIGNLNNKLVRGTADLPDDQVISAYDLDYKLQSGAGIAGYAGQPKAQQGQGQQGVNEGTEYSVGQKRQMMEHPLGDVINLWALKQSYPETTMKNFNNYSSKLIQGSALDINSLNSSPVEFAEQMLKPLTLDEVKAQFKNHKAVQNLRPGTASYMMYVGMAKLLRLRDVLVNLRADLSNVVWATDSFVRSNQLSPQAMREVERGWANWNSRILEMIQRIDDQYQSLSTGVSQTSREAVT